MKELSKIVQESMDSAKNTLPQEILGAMEHRGFYDCGKYLDDDVIEPVIKHLISSQISLLEAELQHLESKELHGTEEFPLYDWEFGYNKALQDQITYLQEQIRIIREM